MRSLYLASESKRRIDILNYLGIAFICIPNVLKEEHLDSDLEIEIALQKLSSEKARISAQEYKGLILGADTIVYLEGKILGKPSTQEEAFETLSFLSGKTHQVLSAASVFDTETNQCLSCIEKAEVSFNRISPEEIDYYIKIAKPFDKAGSYGIQDLPSHFIQNIKGELNTILGLPVPCLLQILKGYGIVGKKLNH